MSPVDISLLILFTIATFGLATILVGRALISFYHQQKFSCNAKILKGVAEAIKAYRVGKDAQ